MNDFKVNPKAETANVTGGPHSQSATPHTNHPNQPNHTPHHHQAHDQTPVRHRELQSHGHHNRARVEGNSGRGNEHSRPPQLNTTTPQTGAVNLIGEGQRGSHENRNVGLEGNRHGNHEGRHSHGSHHSTTTPQTSNVNLTGEGQRSSPGNRYVDSPGNRYGNHEGRHSHGSNHGNGPRSDRSDLRGNWPSQNQSIFGSRGNQESRFLSEHGNVRSRLNDVLRAFREEFRSNDFRNFGSENQRGVHGRNRGEGLIQRVAERLENRLGADRFGDTRGERNQLKELFKDFRFDHRSDNTRRSPDWQSRFPDRVAQRFADAVESRLRLGDSPATVARQTINEASEITRLRDHFAVLEKIGGEPVRQAYRSAMEFLLPERVSNADRVRFAVDLLHDLRSGAFLHPRELETPFPLTGRARIVSEMIELMRTLDAIEKFGQELKNRFQQGTFIEPNRLPFGQLVNPEYAELFARLLNELGPTFPGLAGKLEIHRLVLTLGGILTDINGRPLLMLDGSSLRLGELLFLNTLVDSPSPFGFDRLSFRLSSPSPHGFDAVYSLIGFDGRSLSMPQFIAIQSQVNGYNFDWVAGEPPLGEGWIRAAIEFLKDSVSFEHNVLGESLEEALTGGRFHLAVMRGTVEEGQAVPGSFSFSKVFN